MPSLFIAIAWDEGRPVRTTTEDESEAIEWVKDRLPYSDSVHLFETDETGEIIRQIRTDIW